MQDCEGVWGGKAYMRTDCNGKEICVDGNAGMINNQLPSGAAEAFNKEIEKMQQNCLQAALLNNLSSDYGISVRLENGSNLSRTGKTGCAYNILDKI